MNENKYWQMDNDNIVKTHKITATEKAINDEKMLEIFEFEVRRYKDIKSKKEQLQISAKVDGEDYGTIDANLNNLESEIVRFKSYGVVLGRAKYVELCKLITDNYYYFQPELIQGMEYDVTSDDINEVLEMLCQYIYDNNLEVKEVKERTGNILRLYHIPVTEFNSQLSDSKYRSYNFVDIKEGLRKNNYTHSNKGKLDYVLNDDGQRMKMISIHENIVKPVLKEIIKEEEGR